MQAQATTVVEGGKLPHGPHLTKLESLTTRLE
jgi:hypothetical protein